MSEEIDSTTSNHNAASIASSQEIDAIEMNNDHRVNIEMMEEAVSSAVNSVKRKLSDDINFNEGEDTSSDEVKKQRMGETNQTNEVASTSGFLAEEDVSTESLVDAPDAEASAVPQVDAGVAVKVEIKEEPQDESEGANGVGQSTSTFHANIKVEPKSEVKCEPKDAEESVKTEEATSSVRDSCQYGIKCYRDGSMFPTPSKKQWTSKDIAIMLKMVKERPVIWQVDYSDRTSRPNAFLEIEKVLGFPALEIKRKLHNMRCTFRNQFKSAQFNNKPVKWKFYDAMKFMYSSTFTIDGADPWDDDILTKNVEQHKVVPWKKRIRESHSKQSEAKSLEPSYTPPQQVLLNNIEYVQMPCNQSRDDCNTFGDYVAESIRNLPDDLKELAKRQITHLLFDITAYTYARQCNVSSENGDTIVMDNMATDASYTTNDSIYGIYPQTVLNETREVQLGLHEF